MGVVEEVLGGRSRDGWKWGLLDTARRVAPAGNVKSFYLH